MAYPGIPQQDNYCFDDRRPASVNLRIEDVNLTLEAFRVYVHLVARQAKKMPPPSYTEIGVECFRGSYPNAAKSTLKVKAISAVAELIEKGLIATQERVDHAGGRIANNYELLDAKNWRYSSTESRNVRKGRVSTTTDLSRKRRRNKHPGFVYLIQRRDTQGFYKIGCSVSPVRRLLDLEANAGDLSLIAVTSAEDMYLKELEVQEAFAGCRRFGEWFALTHQQIEQLIGQFNFERVLQS